jgi:hypothetical protein
MFEMVFEKMEEAIKLSKKILSIQIFHEKVCKNCAFIYLILKVVLYNLVNYINTFLLD